MIQEPKSFVIDQSKWSYGFANQTKLLDYSGKMDCLGFLIKASNLDESELLDKDELVDIAKNYQWKTKLIEWCGNSIRQTKICDEIIRVNDIKNLNIDSRKSQLIELFKSINIELSFK